MARGENTCHFERARHSNQSWQERATGQKSDESVATLTLPFLHIVCLIKQGKRDNFFGHEGGFILANPRTLPKGPAAQQCRGLINKATPGRTVARPFFRFRLHACAFYVLLPILQRFGRDTIAGSTRGKITEKQTNLCCKFCSYFLKTFQEQLQTWKNLQAMWKASSAEIECMMRSDSACWFVRMMIFMMPCSRFAVSTCTKIKTTDQKTHSMSGRGGQERAGPKQW